MGIDVEEDELEDSSGSSSGIDVEEDELEDSSGSSSGVDVEDVVSEESSGSSSGSDVEVVVSSSSSRVFTIETTLGEAKPTFATGVSISLKLAGYCAVYPETALSVTLYTQGVLTSASVLASLEYT